MIKGLNKDKTNKRSMRINRKYGVSFAEAKYFLTDSGKVIEASNKTNCNV